MPNSHRLTWRDKLGISVRAYIHHSAGYTNFRFFLDHNIQFQRHCARNLDRTFPRWTFSGRLVANWTPVAYQPALFSRTRKGKGSLYSIAERRVPELIAVLGSQPAGDVSHKPGGRLPLLSATVTLATLKRDATNFAAWWTEARWVWTVCQILLPDSVAAAIWTQAVVRLSPAR